MSNPSNFSSKNISIFDQNSLISEKVRRIDGVETVRQYAKRSLLGTGGFANCYLTESVETGKLSATKVVSKSILLSQRTKMRLFNEIRLHKALHHPNVVQFQHCFQDSENVYIFLELCSKQSLSEALQARSVFTTPEIQSLMYGIINGVKYLHSKQIIHRDLKLGNIFLNEHMNIKIGDFGLATKLEFQREYKRTVCGTPNFIAPEVLQGKGYHFEVDIWSIGVILYALYFGVAPFETEDANSTYIRIKECNYSFPRNHNAPKEAVKLIQAIFVRSPASRPTINEMLEHPFFALGNGVYKSLPSICSKRIPTQKELHDNSELIHCSIKELQLGDRKEHEFIREFEEVLQNVYYYRLSNTHSAILYPNSNVVFQTKVGVFLKCSLATNALSKVQNTTEAANLLLAKQQFACCQILKCSRNSTMDSDQPIFEEAMDLMEVPVHVRNVMRHKSGFVMELSHGDFQLRFHTGINYLITKDKIILEITPRGIKTLQSSKKECAKQRLRCPEEWAYVEVFLNYLNRELNYSNQHTSKLSRHSSSIV